MDRLNVRLALQKNKPLNNSERLALVSVCVICCQHAFDKMETRYPALNTIHLQESKSRQNTVLHSMLITWALHSMLITWALEKSILLIPNLHQHINPWVPNMCLFQTTILGTNRATAAMPTATLSSGCSQLHFAPAPRCPSTPDNFITPQPAG